MIQRLDQMLLAPKTRRLFRSFPRSFMATAAGGCLSVSFTSSFPAIAPLTSPRSRPIILFPAKFPPCRAEQAPSNVEVAEAVELGRGRPKFRWVEVGRRATDEQKQAIAKLPWKMTNRCKAVMKQLICFSGETEGEVADLLGEWVRIMKPKRADWLAVLKELKISNHPLFFEVAELALLESSFEAHVRDYTKLIHSYGKQNRLSDAENTLSALRLRGFYCDQVTLTALLDMYSKAGQFSKAEETFEEIKLLGETVDKRSYGAMIMAYIRAGKLEEGEGLLHAMMDQEIFAGSEVYKALLRAYSVAGDAEGAQRIFDAIQIAGLLPDARICALLINAYAVAGLSHRAHYAFENMRRAGIDPSDKCVAHVLCAYEKEGKVSSALEFLRNLERDGISLGKEASESLARWFRRLGVVQDIELVLREFTITTAGTGTNAN